jgi:hypothetical protein
MRSLVCALCLSFAIAGCGSDADDDGGDDDDDTSGEIDAEPGPGDVDAEPGPGDVDAEPGPGPDVEPRSGIWHYDEYDFGAGGDCGDLASQVNADGDFGLEDHGDGTFTITPVDGTDPFDCTLDGDDFHCPERAAASYTEPGLDARLDGLASADGTFSDEENATGQQQVEITCEGSQCGVVELAAGVDFPCTFVADFTLAWQEDL